MAFLRGMFAGLKAPLAAGVVENIYPAHDVYGEVVGKKFFTEFTTAFNSVLKNEVAKILNIYEVEPVFPALSARFWARIALPMLEFGEIIFSSSEVLNKFIMVGEELAKVTVKLIKNSGYEKADDLVYGLATLIDHDRWIAEKVRMIGLDSLAQKLSARAFETTLSFVEYSMDLAFAWVSAASAALDVVREYRRENMHYLMGLCRELAKRVDAYMETLDMVVDDELYEELVGLGLVER